MEKYPRGTHGRFSIPLLIKAEIMLRENYGLGLDGTCRDGDLILAGLIVLMS